MTGRRGSRNEKGEKKYKSADYGIMSADNITDTCDVSSLEHTWA